MSYILDALKKLEHERSRKSRGDGMINISGALFENEHPVPARLTGWKITLAVAAAVLVTFTVTWLFLRPAPERVHPAPGQAASAPVPAEPAPAALQPPVVVQQTSPPEPLAPVTVVSDRPPARPSTSQKKPVKAITPAGDAAADITMQGVRKPAKERKGQELPPEQVIAAPADIKLSGIAWQDERRARRAVVNGFLMQEGGVVSGARITDIYQDRVRFSLSGKTFEIPLISSSLPAVGK